MLVLKFMTIKEKEEDKKPDKKTEEEDEFDWI